MEDLKEDVLFDTIVRVLFVPCVTFSKEGHFNCCALSCYRATVSCDVVFALGPIKYSLVGLLCMKN